MPWPDHDPPRILTWAERHYPLSRRTLARCGCWSSEAPPGSAASSPFRRRHGALTSPVPPVDEVERPLRAAPSPSWIAMTRNRTEHPGRSVGRRGRRQSRSSPGEPCGRRPGLARRAVRVHLHGERVRGPVGRGRRRGCGPPCALAGWHGAGGRSRGVRRGQGALRATRRGRASGSSGHSSCERASSAAPATRPAGRRTGPGASRGRGDLGRPVLVPDAFDEATQVIDARDLVGWALDAVTGGVGGTFNAVGDTVRPGRPPGCRPGSRRIGVAPAAGGGRVAARAGGGARGWAEGRCRCGSGTRSGGGFSTRSNARAKAEGLRLRPLAETLRDGLEWELSGMRQGPRRAGLTDADEADLLTQLG